MNANFTALMRHSRQQLVIFYVYNMLQHQYLLMHGFHDQYVGRTSIGKCFALNWAYHLIKL